MRVWASEWVCARLCLAHHIYYDNLLLPLLLILILAHGRSLSLASTTATNKPIHKSIHIRAHTQNRLSTVRRHCTQYDGQVATTSSHNRQASNRKMLSLESRCRMRPVRRFRCYIILLGFTGDLCVACDRIHMRNSPRQSITSSHNFCLFFSSERMREKWCVDVYWENKKKKKNQIEKWA